MTILAYRFLAASLIGFVLASGTARAETSGSAGYILPGDPRFNVFELSNSAGDGTYTSPVGTVVLTFVSKDQRYCRAARFPADRAMVLACREERGWQIVATSSIAAVEANYPTAVGGSYDPAVGNAVEALRASSGFLRESEIIEAASRGWRDPMPVDEQTFDAREILTRTAQVYRTTESYVDSGTVRTIYAGPSGERTGETHFKTAYVAPMNFRFESNMNDFGNVEVQFIVAHDENGLEAWLSSKPDFMTNISTLQDALDTGAGISRDASGMIPGLIIPGTDLGGDLVRLTDAVRLEDTEIDGFDCFQVQGFRWPNTGRPTTVWIDKENFLIRRVYEEQEFQGVVTKTTWSYEPAINVPVDESALRFGELSSS